MPLTSWRPSRPVGNRGRGQDPSPYDAWPELGILAVLGCCEWNRADIVVAMVQLHPVVAPEP